VKFVATFPKGLRRSYKALEWFLTKSGGGFFDPADPLGPETARALLHTSNVPGPHAVALVAAGFRMSYEQFVNAARNSVRGLRVWVAAHRKLNLDSGLPAYAEGMLVGVTSNSEAQEVSAVLGPCPYEGGKHPLADDSFQHEQDMPFSELCRIGWL
jgi:hypothetical protein